MNRAQIDNYLDKCVYFPFVGWFVLLALGRDGEYYLHHIKQALILALTFAAVLIVLGVTLTMTQRGEGYFKLALVILIYLVDLLYLALCIAGTRAVFRSEKIEFPIIGKTINKYAAKINI